LLTADRGMLTGADLPPDPTVISAFSTLSATLFVYPKRFV